MNILQVHNYYQQAGGEDTVVRNEYKLLTSKGNEVIQFTKSNNSIRNILSKIKLLLSTHYSFRSRREFKKVLESVNPDVVHVHNFFPLFTPSIFNACQNLGIPVVLTLHNFRIFHPNGLLLNRGKIDHRGLVGSAYRCIIDKVYRNSYIQTAVVAHMIEYHKKRNTWNTKVDRLIVLSETSKSIFIKGGIDQGKLVVKPNFIEDRYSEIPHDFDLKQQEYFLYVGRISEEKGIQLLLETLMNESFKINLLIIGNGPIKPRLEKMTNGYNSFKWLGSLDQNIVLKHMKNSLGLIFPSICYENFPMSLVESMSMGIPVIASNIGAAKSIIEHKREGYLYDPFIPSELIQGLKLISDKNVNLEFGQKGREKYLERYSSKRNYNDLIRIYQDAIDEKSNKL